MGTDRRSGSNSRIPLGDREEDGARFDLVWGQLEAADMTDTLVVGPGHIGAESFVCWFGRSTRSPAPDRARPPMTDPPGRGGSPARERPARRGDPRAVTDFSWSVCRAHPSTKHLLEASY